ncbi:MAG: metallophosphoesterase [Clostridia bacterium]|nr:metallophosphoesterase [Clostridia bacterium]
MTIYGISDIHLSFGVNKPMCVFGNVWKNHEEKLKANWNKQVSKDDIIIIAGDISWGLNFSEAKPDFEYINKLPGKKIVLKGNHDYYFSTKAKVNAFLKDNSFDSIEILHNSAIDIGKYILCGTRGWGTTENPDKESDEKLIKREEGRLRLSLEEGKKLQGKENKDILVAMHFPPFISNFQKILEEYNVKKCIYGHLHGYGHTTAKQGFINSVEYIMVGCDYTNFKLIEL